ncbi:MAG: siroheme synthase CysG [Porticoccaceae bacterium]
MDYLPLFHNLRQRRCLVVGGGPVALRKLQVLIEAGAQVHVVAPAIGNAIHALATAGMVTTSERAWREDDLAGVALVIAATDDPGLNRRVSVAAQLANIPVNVVDNPDLCTVIFPAIVDRSPIQIAISTGGTAPVLARLLRTRLETLLPAGYGNLARLAGKFRDRVKVALPHEIERRAFWEQVFQGQIAELVYTEHTIEAEDMLAELLVTRQRGPIGEVYLVGGGPGDPDLLTFRALRLMQQADIVLYDRLVSKEVLAMVRRDAERIYVGKTVGDHPVTQDNINLKLVEFARQGKRVLRLKGGDPFIFGRGGEEIAHLADQGIPFQVVPGITAASGCASYAGIPLTHRDYAHSVRFIAGHKKSGELELDWKTLITPGQTLVFYMGLNGLESICDNLIKNGMAVDTPAALIEKGTTPRQRVFVGDLRTLPGRARRGGAKAPTLIIIGQVVRLRDKLSWFGTKAGSPSITPTEF